MKAERVGLVAIGRSLSANSLSAKQCSRTGVVLSAPRSRSHLARRPDSVGKLGNMETCRYLLRIRSTYAGMFAAECREGAGADGCLGQQWALASTRWGELPSILFWGPGCGRIDEDGSTPRRWSPAVRFHSFSYP